MVTVIFRAKMQPGKEDEAVAAMTKMAEAVHAAEDGTLAYIVCRAQDDPSQLIIMEHYKDDASFKSHMETPHMGEMRGAFTNLFDTTQVKAERLDRVAGFTRG